MGYLVYTHRVSSERGFAARLCKGDYTHVLYAVKNILSCVYLVNKTDL
jgi:hypothetical protein